MKKYYIHLVYSLKSTLENVDSVNSLSGTIERGNNIGSIKQKESLLNDFSPSETFNVMYSQIDELVKTGKITEEEATKMREPISMLKAERDIYESNNGKMTEELTIAQTSSEEAEKAVASTKKELDLAREQTKLIQEGLNMAQTEIAQLKESVNEDNRIRLKKGDTLYGLIDSWYFDVKNIGDKKAVLDMIVNHPNNASIIKKLLKPETLTDRDIIYMPTKDEIATMLSKKYEQKEAGSGGEQKAPSESVSSNIPEAKMRKAIQVNEINKDTKLYLEIAKALGLEGASVEEVTKKIFETQEASNKRLKIDGIAGQRTLSYLKKSAKK